MFGTVLIVVCSLMHAYVFWRASTASFIRGRAARRWLVAAAALLWLLLVGSRVVAHGSEGALAAAVELVGMTWMAMLFLASVTLLAVDLATGFGWLLPRLAPRMRGLALMAAGAMSLLALIQGLRPPVIERHQVTVSGLPAGLDGTVIIAMSDLHVGSLLGERWLDARFRQVEEQRPDLVLLLGDLLEGHGGEQEHAAPLLGRLSAPLGVWAVTGNHEYHRRSGATPPPLEAAGIRVLHDSWAPVAPGLVIAGVDDLTSRRRDGGDGGAVTRALEGAPRGALILLSHTPWGAAEAARAGADLMLAGHTHGGQIWPFGVLVARVYPLLAGRYDVDGMPVIVCRGTGTWGPRMRLWRPGEILRITLRAAVPAARPEAPMIPGA